MRVTTLYASSAAATAACYTKYLLQAAGEEPGVWRGSQADAFGLTGQVNGEQLEALLPGRDPTRGTQIGTPLRDRTTTNGTTVRAVAGFDATLSAPKSLSVWWALAGDPGLVAAHDTAVGTVIAHLERCRATTGSRLNDGRLHPDTAGLPSHRSGRPPRASTTRNCTRTSSFPRSSKAPMADG